MTTPITTPAEALEAAARTAHSHADDRPRITSMDYSDGYMDGCRNAADAIRALATRIPPLSDDVAGLVARLRVTKITTLRDAAALIAMAPDLAAAVLAHPQALRDAMVRGYEIARDRSLYSSGDLPLPADSAALQAALAKIGGEA